MGQVKVYCADRGGFCHLDCEDVKCPGCGTYIVPRYLAVHSGESVCFCECPIQFCGALFLVSLDGLGLELLPNHSLERQSFSDFVQDVSPSFVKIYNEAFSAEQMSLMEICGAGYRKSLEFLIKDYISRDKDADTILKIQKMPLSQCISAHVTDQRIKAVSNRAVWLGNDETHYVRKWEDKDVQDLKGLINLTVRWIEQEIETQQLLEEMQEGK